MNTASHDRELRSEHTIHVGQLSSPVRIRIFRLGNGGYEVDSSHYLKTSIQYMPHTINSVYNCEESQVLEQYQATLYGFYDQAVRRDYLPSESWLVENPSFLTGANSIASDAKA
jgi:hypothetical protein